MYNLGIHLFIPFHSLLFENFVFTHERIHWSDYYDNDDESSRDCNEIINKNALSEKQQKWIYLFIKLTCDSAQGVNH